jgi:hypothetical protein
MAFTLHVYAVPFTVNVAYPVDLMHIWMAGDAAFKEPLHYNCYYMNAWPVDIPPSVIDIMHLSTDRSVTYAHIS